MNQKLHLIGVNELAEILGVRPSFIYARTRLKGPDSMPFLKIGKYIKFELNKVMDWIRKKNEADY